MKLLVIRTGQMYASAFFAVVCACGWKSQWRATLEAAGRDADLHMAEKFPLPSSSPALRCRYRRYSRAPGAAGPTTKKLRRPGMSPTLCYWR
jgi:hypothetical protein